MKNYEVRCWGHGWTWTETVQAESSAEAEQKVSAKLSQATERVCSVREI